MIRSADAAKFTLFRYSKGSSLDHKLMVSINPSSNDGNSPTGRHYGQLAKDLAAWTPI